MVVERSTRETMHMIGPLSDLFWKTARSLQEFMDSHVYPNELLYHQQAQSGGWTCTPPIIGELRQEAKQRGLWNLFLPSESGLSVLEYAHLAQTMGRTILGPIVTNCAAPDTGNMEVLHLYGSPY